MGADSERKMTFPDGTRRSAALTRETRGASSRGGCRILAMAKPRIITVVLGMLLLIATAATAQRPEEDISPARHPNLAEAQRLIRHAFEKITAAQQANEWDMHGHAQKAKDLLDRASAELKMAAEAANR
jgi:hypothetical protein